jgi:PhnB protein
MKIRSYLTFDGNCAEALELYKRAFQTETMQEMRFKEMPPNPNFQIPAEYEERILQATLKFGDDYIRLSDCGPGHIFSGVSTERLSLSIEATIDEVKHAFNILAEEGRIGMELNETFYSPCAGIVFDRFGVMWNFAADVKN